MNLKQLDIKVKEIIENIKNNGYFLKENDLIDYKEKLTYVENLTNEKIILKNFARDILSFANAEGGILMLGFQENQESKAISDKGLEEVDIKTLQKLDVNKLSDQLTSIIGIKLSLDIQTFKIASRKFGYILIEKSNEVLIPHKNYTEYKLIKGEVLYRLSGSIQLMNKNTPEFNRFIQIKSNEKNKEFMQIWSHLLPEMVDINPKEVLIINPEQKKVYGFNSKDNTLSGGDIEIETEDNKLSVILQNIKAGDIGKITNSEGKPAYKIIAETKKIKAPIPLTDIVKTLKFKTQYKFNPKHIKKLAHYKGWVTTDNFQIYDFSDDILVLEHSELMWSEIINATKGSKRIVFSQEAEDELYDLITNIKIEDLVKLLGTQISKEGV